MVVDLQDDTLWLMSRASELSMATSCMFSKVEVCKDVNSEQEGPDVVVLVAAVSVVIVVAFPILDDGVVKLMLLFFSLNVPFPM